MAKVAEPEVLAARRRTLGALVQGARAKLGKSKQDCAQAMGITVAAYTAYEEGRRDATLPELELLAYYLKVPVRLFFERPERLLADDPEIPVEKVLALRQRIVGQGYRVIPLGTPFHGRIFFEVERAPPR